MFSASADTPERWYKCRDSLLLLTCNGRTKVQAAANISGLVLAHRKQTDFNQ